MIITPTWQKFSIGTYIRREKDKRRYVDLFTTENEINGIRKLYAVLFCHPHFEQGLQNYFTDFLNDADYIRNYIIKHIRPSIKAVVDKYDFCNCIAVHIRLGDFPEEHRTPLEWYKEKIIAKGMECNYRFLLFSDGTDEELKDLMAIPNVERVFFGNAIADIYAISKCCFMIGSDSTFSGWGAFLGQVPCVFFRKHYGQVLMDKSKEIVEDSTNTWL
ncbi:MAG: alpha-1,2-fucosyltransferase [Oscillospiraceae bacterium]|nr:alpha-1,2-fucosyltransferase [Oscillospiraceae bacterium]